MWEQRTPALPPTTPFLSDPAPTPGGPEGHGERTQTFLGREVQELIHFVRLQLDLRNNGLARRIHLKEGLQTQFLKASNSPAETPRGAIHHLRLPLWSHTRHRWLL